MDRDKNSSNIEGEDFSPQARDVFNEWFDSFDDSTGYLDSLTEDEKKKHRKQLFDKTKRGLNVDKERNSLSGPAVLHQLGAHPFGKVAAILVVGVFLSLAGLYWSNSFVSKDSNQVVMVQRTNQAGELSKLTLADGSIIWLGAASTLKYPKSFSDSLRHIELDGQAYFEVQHKVDSPFVVSAGGIKTRVLGTKFNVEAYKEDQESIVTLTSGKVEVTSSSTANPVVLSPDEQFRFDKQNGTQKVRTVNASLVNAWTNKELVFVRESLAQIAKTFERWYGVKFFFQDPSLKEEVFVYHFKEFSLPQSLEILSKLANFKYKINDNKVTISNI